MFDDEPIEVGKERNRFLTEESGRRVYFPFVGLARVVPSRDHEAKLRKAQLFVFIAGMALMGVTTIIRPFMPEQSFPFLEGWIGLLMLGTHQLITSHLVRHWVAIPATDLSYARYARARHAKRSLIGLCIVIVTRVLILVGVTAALAWLITHSPPPGWDNWTGFKKVSFAMPFVFLLILAWLTAISGYRVVSALRIKYWTR